jgi:hypothetical protein
MALVRRGCSGSVQRLGCEKPPKKEAHKMLTIGWLAVLLGVLAMQWADGRFPFSASL